MGAGLLLILAGIGPEDLDEFHRWYDREHLPERLGLPGFRQARRFASEGAVRPWAALYDTEGTGVFRSAAYREALSRQSDWSRKMLPRFVDPCRSVSETRLRLGAGGGDGLALGVITGGPDDPAAAEASFHTAGGHLLAGDARLVTLGLHATDPELSRPVAEYPPSAPPPVAPGDWVVTVEACDPLTAGEALAALCRTALGLGLVPLGRFRFRNGMTVLDL